MQNLRCRLKRSGIYRRMAYPFGPPHTSASRRNPHPAIQRRVADPASVTDPIRTLVFNRAKFRLETPDLLRLLDAKPTLAARAVKLPPTFRPRIGLQALLQKQSSQLL